MMDLKRCMTLDLLLFFTFEVLRLMSTGIAVVVYVVFYAFKKVRRDQLNGFAHKSTFERQDCQSLEAVEKSLSDAVQGLKVIYGHYSEVKYIERWLKYEEGASVPWLRQVEAPSEDTVRYVDFDLTEVQSTMDQSWVTNESHVEELRSLVKSFVEFVGEDTFQPAQRFFLFFSGDPASKGSLFRTHYAFWEMMFDHMLRVTKEKSAFELDGMVDYLFLPYRELIVFGSTSPAEFEITDERRRRVISILREEGLLPSPREDESVPFPVLQKEGVFAGTPVVAKNSNDRVLCMHDRILSSWSLIQTLRETDDAPSNPAYYELMTEMPFFLLLRCAVDGHSIPSIGKHHVQQRIRLYCVDAFHEILKEEAKRADGCLPPSEDSLPLLQAMWQVDSVQRQWKTFTKVWETERDDSTDVLLFVSAILRVTPLMVVEVLSKGALISLSDAFKESQDSKADGSLEKKACLQFITQLREYCKEATSSLDNIIEKVVELSTLYDSWRRFEDLLKGCVAIKSSLIVDSVDHREVQSWKTVHGPVLRCVSERKSSGASGLYATLFKLSQRDLNAFREARVCDKFEAAKGLICTVAQLRRICTESLMMSCSMP